MIMAKKTQRHNNIKHGTIELVLLLLLQSGRKYGYQLAQELSEHTSSQYELKETTMYPTLYRLNKTAIWIPNRSKSAKDELASIII